MQHIILDANFLMIPAQFRVDIFTELERICDFRFQLQVPEEVVGELTNLSTGSGNDAQAAKLALQLIKAQHINIIPKSSKTEGFKKADNVILQLAKQDNAMIATQDKELKQRAQEAQLRVIVLRKQQSLLLI